MAINLSITIILSCNTSIDICPIANLAPRVGARQVEFGGVNRSGELSIANNKCAEYYECTTFNIL